jgi:hypothetical protein
MHESYFVIYSNTIKRLRGSIPLKANVREIGWLKHLKVAISTSAGMPSG